MINIQHNSDLEAAIAVFLEILRGGWNHVSNLASVVKQTNPEQYLSDWAQANWEAIVEVAVGTGGKIFIEPYGDGADCNAVGSRVWMPGVVPTHAVHCIPREGTRALDHLMHEEVSFPKEGLLVDRFACLTDEGWYAERPPFDHVLTISAGREAIFHLGDVRFALHAVEAMAAQAPKK